LIGSCQAALRHFGPRSIEDGGGRSIPHRPVSAAPPDHPTLVVNFSCPSNVAMRPNAVCRVRVNASRIALKRPAMIFL
jgi:hypothetical protein